MPIEKRLGVSNKTTVKAADVHSQLYTVGNVGVPSSDALSHAFIPGTRHSGNKKLHDVDIAESENSEPYYLNAFRMISDLTEKTDDPLRRRQMRRFFVTPSRLRVIFKWRRHPEKRRNIKTFLGNFECSCVILLIVKTRRFSAQVGIWMCFMATIAQRTSPGDRAACSR